MKDMIMLTTDDVQRINHMKIISKATTQTIVVIVVAIVTVSVWVMEKIMVSAILHGKI